MSASTILTSKRGFVRSPAFLAASLALAAALPMSAMAEIQKTNPVTGEAETYTWKFVGTDTWGQTQYWQDSDRNPPSGVPAKTSDNTWDPILFDGNTININDADLSVEGWNLRMGLYNGATVTINNLVKYQGDTTMWTTVDESSQLTIGGFGGGNITANQVIKLSVAKANGITWNVNLTSGNANNTFEYYLKGAGSVSYQAVSAANHKIKMADVTLTGTSQVSHKTLVSFTSAPTFTADASIKVLNGSTVVATKALTAVNTTATLTTDNAVGTCELVQTSTGIDLYWVDGDPANLPAATVYKPSININFTSGTALSTVADVGISEYAIPGTSWNNLTGNNGSLATVTCVDDAGVTSTINGAKVTISGTRGYYYNGNVQAASDLRQGYIDDNSDNPSPQFVVEGIPYYSYKTILYFSSDNNETKFGYVTVNGAANYKGDLDNTATVASEGGSDIWGSASVSAFTEGGNYLVIPTQINTDGKLTVVSHRLTGSRAGLAAVQIIEVKPDVGENDLEIAVNGDTNYSVSETKDLTGTVYLTGNGTLTLDGSAKITASTIDVGLNVTLVVNADRLDATTFSGGGTVVYNNAFPVTGKGWTDSSAWTGTVWINGKSGVTDFNVNSYGNANSAVKLSGVDGWISAPFDNTVPVVLENGKFEYALKLTNGNSPNNQYPKRCTTFVKVSGSGTISDGGSANPMLKIYDGTKFTGALTLTRARVVFCAADSTTLPDAYNTGIPAASIYVDSGNSATVASGMTWTADGGFIVDGTLNVDGTLASSQAAKAVSGSGTVVFNGKLPSPTGDAWWTNSDWDGTVQIKDAAFTGVSGVATYLEVNKYGNDGSILELNNCSGWLPVGNTAGDNVCSVPLKVTGTLTINNGYSGRTFTINKLLGSGAIYTTSNDATTTIQVLSADDFTGYVNLNSKRVVFGETLPATFTAGQIYVGSGFSFTVPNSDAAWYGTGGILLDGELKAAALSNFGGGTTITTTDNGVFTLINSDNTDDKGEDYARITGTGTLRYADVADKWRSLSAVNFPTNMICENNLSSGLILTTIGENTIGSLAGDGYLRSDWGGSKGDRDLRVLQATNTTWSGKFWTANEHRLRSLIVAPGTTTSGTLTISATHEAAECTGLTVESGANVNITGTWVGDTTVAGTLGGTGTIDGNLTVNGGCIFAELAAEPLEPLKVTGDVTFSGAITIVYPEGTKLSDIQEIIKVTGTGSMSRDNASFTVKAGSKVIGRALISGNALCTLQNQFFIRLR